MALKIIGITPVLIAAPMRPPGGRIAGFAFPAGRMVDACLLSGSQRAYPTKIATCEGLAKDSLDTQAVVYNPYGGGCPHKVYHARLF